MGYHTAPQDSKLFLGSAKVSIADYNSDHLLAVWNPLGTLSAFSISPSVTTAKPDAVNGEHKQYVTEEIHSIAFSMQEIIAENMKKAMGDLTSIEIETGSPVTGFDQDVAIDSKAKGVFIPFTQQNYAGGSIVVPDNIVVTEDPEGTPVVLTLNDDYVVMQDEYGRFGIVPTNDGLWDQTKLNRITYDYTPKAKTIIHQGGKNNITEKMVKIEHEEDDGRIITIIYYKCEFSEGGGLNFKKDGAAEIIDFNVTVKAKNDRSKEKGKQLYRKEILEAA